VLGVRLKPSYHKLCAVPQATATSHKPQGCCCYYSRLKTQGSVYAAQTTDEHKAQSTNHSQHSKQKHEPPRATAREVRVWVRSIKHKLLNKADRLLGLLLLRFAFFALFPSTTI
jgi:hypothetical protein